MPYNYEDTGLPDNPLYKKSFEKGLKALITVASASTPEEVQESFRHISVMPARLVCQLGLPAKKEECIVKTLLNGHSAFTNAANCEVRKLQKALSFGLEALSENVEKFRTASDAMSPDERLMTQLAIYGLVEGACEAAQETDLGSTIANTHDYATTLLAAFQAVSRMDYPLVDEVVERKVQRIAERMAEHPAPHGTDRLSPPKPPRITKGFF